MNLFLDQKEEDITDINNSQTSLLFQLLLNGQNKLETLKEMMKKTKFEKNNYKEKLITIFQALQDDLPKKREILKIIL